MGGFVPVRKGAEEDAKPRAVAVKVAGTLGAREAFGEVLWVSGKALLKGPLGLAPR